MYTVIIPTMWRGRELTQMWPHLIQHHLIDEIIVIDNDEKRRPKIQDNPKLKIINHHKNTYVNPAWNLGIEQAKNDKLCLLSDDVLVHPCAFDQLHEAIKPTTGLFGPTRAVFSTKVVAKNIHLKETSDAIPLCGFGCVMFMHKEATTKIPDQLKIYFGDNWLFAYNALKRKVPNYYLENIDIATSDSTTSHSKEFDSQHLEEHKIVEQLFDKEFGQGVYSIEREFYRNGYGLNT